MMTILNNSTNRAYPTNDMQFLLNLDLLSERRKIIDNTVTVLDKKTINDSFKQAHESRKDPLDLIDLMLSQYIRNQTDKAESLAKEISEKSKAIAEINRLWGQVMSSNIQYLDPTKTEKTISLYNNSAYHLNTIDVIIKDTLGGNGIIDILDGKNSVNYDMLQSINATMTAYCDTAQVDLDSLQQDFKNMMTELTSAQEEIRDIRRAVISFAER
ncbi:MULTISPECIES: hypothetical protein [Yersinia]|uniref:hypothetical protein n=1 Tax=Yersinia TaxID=629 RepID=UPI000B3351A4|nr:MULTISPECIES: hypothetical protein [Yersinia]MBW5812549.1 hypothetical protein [Yersinia kristensenii]MBW5817927.1 hypothetical protein [Yersinia kristensenii]MBW5829850.1 hypothetical protein [Yersinia kristensenii]MBW5842243.1 hypothetical protein [Yersinia kristensenii]MDA5490295.1 hypothetical protein [Yersinia kristensenii]